MPRSAPICCSSRRARRPRTSGSTSTACPRPESLFDDQADPLGAFQGCIDWWGGKDAKGREETPHAWKVTAEEIKARGYNLDIKNPHAVADDHGDPETLLADLHAPRPRRRALRDQLKAILAEALAR